MQAGLVSHFARQNSYSKKEWVEALNPNARCTNTYWQVNIELMKGNDNLELVNGEAEVVPGISVIHTGGRQIVRMKSRTEIALHFGDFFPTHANP